MSKDVVAFRPTSVHRSRVLGQSPLIETTREPLSLAHDVTTPRVVYRRLRSDEPMVSRILRPIFVLSTIGFAGGYAILSMIALGWAWPASIGFAICTLALMHCAKDSISGR